MVCVQKVLRRLMVGEQNIALARRACARLLLGREHYLMFAINLSLHKLMRTKCTTSYQVPVCGGNELRPVMRVLVPADCS